MADIVNLRRVKKARERAAKEMQAAENRTRFGTPKALLKLNKSRTAKEKGNHEAKRLEPDKPRQG